MSGETWTTVVGNLTADPELRYTSTGRAVANFTIASTPKKFDGAAGKTTDGETLFIRCTVWGEFAEHVNGTLAKGIRAVAYGRLNQRSWQDSTGATRNSIELDIEAVGPDLRWARATIERIVGERQRPSEPGYDNEPTWNSETPF